MPNMISAWIFVEKIKKALYELISKSENPVVKDLIAQIKVFTDHLSENTCDQALHWSEKWNNS